MQQRDKRLLIFIAVLALCAGWIAWPTDPGLHFLGIDTDISIHQGLDLQGGIQILLQADLAEGQELDSDAMDAARSIVENRVNGLGVTEPVVQRVGTDRIQVELPGLEDPEAAIAMLRETGLMEWVDTGSTYVAPGTLVRTDLNTGLDVNLDDPDGPIYDAILSGSNLKTAQVALDDTNTPMISFELDSEGADIFAEHTANHTNEYVAIVLDGEVISCPVISSTIPDGQGVIQGSFTLEEAQNLVLQLRYGALPVPLTVIDTQEVGPTLGEDSVSKSVRAGIIGVVVVFLFMVIYYRLPGALADVALLMNGLITMSLYKLIPVTITLPGIAGFLLSLGMAVDANILIFERMREELRAGRSLDRAITSGFKRAWSSILDSNISTWITCAILYAFGGSFGASSVKGFALTLAIGVAVNMFTAVTVTRTLLKATFALTGEELRSKKWLLGV